MTTDLHVVDVPGLFDSRQRGFAQCVTAGDFVFVSGQGGLDERFQLVSDQFAPQARQALLSVRMALEAAGASPATLTAVTIYLTDMSNLRDFNALKREIWGETRATSTAVAVSALAIPGMLVEVTVTAVKG